MIEALKEIVVLLWDEIKVAYIIPEYEGAVLLRFGKYKRTDTAGLHWKWPVIDQVHTTSKAVTTVQPGAQSLITRDGHNIVLSTVIKYQIKDVKPYLLEIEDRDDVLTDVTMGAVREVVRTSTLKQLDVCDKKLLKKVRREVGRYGFKIHDVTLIDLAPIKTLRLMVDGVELGE